MIVDLEKKLAEVNAEHEEVESNLLAKKREIEPVEAKLQVRHVFCVRCFRLVLFCMVPRNCDREGGVVIGKAGL